MINRRAVLYATFALVLRKAAASLNETLTCGTRALDLRWTTLMSEDERYAVKPALMRQREGFRATSKA
jgi:hypothetical protein